MFTDKDGRTTQNIRFTNYIILISLLLIHFIGHAHCAQDYFIDKFLLQINYRTYQQQNMSERLLVSMRSFYEDGKQRVTDMYSIRLMYEESPMYEEGYLMAEILERYKKMIDIAVTTIYPPPHKTRLLMDMISYTERVQHLYFEIYHLVRMMNEVSRKYWTDTQFTEVLRGRDASIQRDLRLNKMEMPTTTAPAGLKTKKDKEGEDDEEDSYEKSLWKLGREPTIQSTTVPPPKKEISTEIEEPETEPPLYDDDEEAGSSPGVPGKPVILPPTQPGASTPSKPIGPGGISPGEPGGFILGDSKESPGIKPIIPGKPEDKKPASPPGGAPPGDPGKPVGPTTEQPGGAPGKPGEPGKPAPPGKPETPGKPGLPGKVPGIPGLPQRPGRPGLPIIPGIILGLPGGIYGKKTSAKPEESSDSETEEFGISPPPEQSAVDYKDLAKLALAKEKQRIRRLKRKKKQEMQDAEDTKLNGYQKISQMYSKAKYPSTKRYNKWWPIDYGWEIDYYW